ncbi:MAG: hypothetical protein M1370_02755 [Bacteroidetes bacterium]|nr:hypothetical protein [Bacteroidota bacterium]
MAGRSMGGKDHIIKKMLLHTMERCSVCGREFAEDDLRILGHQDDMWFLMVICHNCQTQGLLAVSVKEEPVNKPIIDVTEEEQARFAAMTPICVDDVLDMHEFLREFDGDFAVLFQQS